MATTVYGNVLNTLSQKPGRPIITHQGGEAYAIDALSQMRRFLILGTDGNSFYVGKQELTIENAKAVVAAIEQHGSSAVDLVVEVSEKGQAFKQEPTIMALAIAAASKNDKVRKAALAAIPKVCRTGTTLFQFAEMVQTMRGWGRGLRNAVGAWYLDKDLDDLVYQVIKYRQRGGWTHADLLRLAHPKTEDPYRNVLFKWIVDGEVPTAMVPTPAIVETSDLDQLWAFQSLQATDDKATVLRLIENFRLPREAVPTQWLNDPEVWEALLKDMPITAMVRNLATMTGNGLLTTRSEATQLVIDRLGDAQRLKKSRIHPMQVLIALKTYAHGRGVKSSKIWTPIPRIIDALDDAFYGSFGNVVPTNRDILVAVDSSGSMQGQVVGVDVPMTTVEAAAAMALIHVATEPYAEVVAFDTRLHHPAVSAKQRLDDATRLFDRYGGGTHCHLPVQYALDSGRAFDAIVMYTDNANGGISLYQPLDQYRAKLNRGVRFVSAAMAAYHYSCARPTDPLALDLVGLDPTVPEIIGGFLRGQV